MTLIYGLIIKVRLSPFIYWVAQNFTSLGLPANKFCTYALLSQEKLTENQSKNCRRNHLHASLVDFRQLLVIINTDYR